MIKVSAVNDAVARELDVFLVLQIREALVVEEVFENVFERALLAVYALDLLVFDLLVALACRSVSRAVLSDPPPRSRPALVARCLSSCLCIRTL